jgi:DNA-nicking Smr family endonuclease
LKKRIDAGKNDPSDKKDAGSFRDYVGPVRPLEVRSRRVPPPLGRASEPKNPRGAALPVFDTSDDGQMMRGVRRGFEDALSDLECDRLPMDETLDLHGMRADEAKQTLLRFCKDLRGRGRATIVVVHGRGAHSPGGRGILRDEMASWLSSPPLAEYVLCFSTAPAKRGGVGAVCVVITPRR